MPQLCFSTAARLAAKLLFYIESSSFLCILSYNANTPLDDVGRNVAKIVHHAMLAGHSRCADYALGFVLVAFFDVNAALVIVAGALAGSVTCSSVSNTMCEYIRIRSFLPYDGVPDRFRRLCFTPPCVIYNHEGGTLITTNRMFDIK